MRRAVRLLPIDQLASERLLDARHLLASWVRDADVGLCGIFLTKIRSGRNSFIEATCTCCSELAELLCEVDEAKEAARVWASPIWDLSALKNKVQNRESDSPDEQLLVAQLNLQMTLQVLAGLHTFGFRPVDQKRRNVARGREGRSLELYGFEKAIEAIQCLAVDDLTKLTMLCWIYHSMLATQFFERAAIVYEHINVVFDFGAQLHSYEGTGLREIVVQRVLSVGSASTANRWVQSNLLAWLPPEEFVHLRAVSHERIENSVYLPKFIHSGM